MLNADDNNHQAHRFALEQRLQSLQINHAFGQHRQLDNAHFGGFQQAQDHPVARRLNHHGGSSQLEHRNQNFQYAAQISADIDVIRLPAMHR